MTAEAPDFFPVEPEPDPEPELEPEEPDDEPLPEPPKELKPLVWAEPEPEAVPVAVCDIEELLVELTRVGFWAPQGCCVLHDTRQHLAFSQLLGTAQSNRGNGSGDVETYRQSVAQELLWPQPVTHWLPASWHS